MNSKFHAIFAACRMVLLIKTKFYHLHFNFCSMLIPPSEPSPLVAYVLAIGNFCRAAHYAKMRISTAYNNPSANTV